jgi:Uma2 family endonuclease
VRYSQPDPISLKDFLEWEQTQQDKHELINGRVVPFASVSKDHNHIAGNIYVALRAHARPPCTVYGTDIIIETISRSGDNGYRADAVVSCAEEDRAGTDRYVRHPKIVVEVRSPKSNRGKEWDAKLFEYWGTPSIEQIVIVEAEARAASSFLRSSTGIWHPVIDIGECERLSFPLVDLSMTLDEVYQFSSLASEKS